MQNRGRTCALALGYILGYLLLPITVLAQTTVLTHHNDNNRTGANLGETILNTSNVNASQFGKLFSLPVDGQVYTQPLYVPNVAIPSQGTHNVLYVGTENDTLYAFDADMGGSPLWQKSLGTPLSCNPSTPMPLSYRDCTVNFSPWYNMFPLVGITATPVIDPATNTMYVVNVSVVSGQQQQFIHALDITTGSEKLGGPVQIQASVPGTGDGGSTVTYDPVHSRLRTALTLVNGLIVFGAAAYSDWQPYHGWAFAYSASSLQQISVWCSTPNGVEGGVWQAGSGFVVDSSGNIYGISGNGDFDGSSNFGMSVFKLSSSGLKLLDYFAPSSEAAWSGQDLDLGSAGPLAIPGTNYLVAGGKEGILYLLNENNLGHFNSSADQVVQEFQATTAPDPYYHHIHGAPVYWNGPAGKRVYVWGESDHLKAFQFNGTSFNNTPVSQSAAWSPATGGNPPLCTNTGGTIYESCMPGGFLSISANGGTAGTGILWANTPYSGNAEAQIQPGILHAYDAANLSNELWNSYQNQPRDDFGYFGKFVPPTIANGKVYMATFSNQLVVYGLLSGTFAPIRINAGGSTYTDTSGNVWTSDTGFNAGSTFSTTQTIGNTTAQPLYQTERFGTFQYQFSVPNGNYTVNLKFAEIYFTSSGQRVFNVAINGTAVLSNFDIVAQAGAFTAIDKSFPVTVSGGSITIQFTPTVDNAKISAIEILPQSAAVSVAVSPTTASLGPSQTQQFTATVTGSSNTSVTWSVSPSAGAVSPTGLYTAPATIPTTVTVYVKATSVADTTKSASGAVTLTPGSTTFTPIRVNAGGPSYTDPSGKTWSADTGFDTGSTYSTTQTIAGTSTPVLYQSERFGTFQYRFTVPNGNYALNLKFAEIYFTSAGQRVFNVAVNGTSVLSNFDIVAQAGSFTAIDKSFPVTVSGGALTIQFTPTVNNAKISAIEILPQSAGVSVAVSPTTASLGPSQTQQFTATVSGSSNTSVTWSISPSTGSISSTGLYTAPATISSSQTVTVKATSVADTTKSATATVTLTPPAFTPIRVNAGGPSYTDPSGNAWSADTGFDTGSTYSTTQTISGTTTPILYQTERFGTFQYQFTVPNGSHTVNLKFAEIYFTTAGQRVFNVAINGTTVLSNFDIVAQAGAFTAIDKSFPVTVSGGTLTIRFTPTVNNAKISAIEIK